MLKAKTLKTPIALGYFQQGVYGQGRWYGKGAKLLKLAGTINFQHYRQLLQGNSPSGRTQLRAVRQKAECNRAAVDCVFCAPKSVSLQALVGGDERLIEAHRRAVNQTVEIIESRYAQTRLWQKAKGKQVRTATGNLLVAQFDHIEARAVKTKGEPSPLPDPHLHTHCVILNLTCTPEGKWRSLHNDLIFKHLSLMGMTYQHFLALEVQSLGYEIVPTGKGQFDLAGVSPKAINHFSKRQQAIKALLKQNSEKTLTQIWEETRQRKQNYAGEQLKRNWQLQSDQIQFKPLNIPQTQNHSSSASPLSLEQALQSAIAHCSQRQVAFWVEDIKKTLLSQNLPLNPLDLEQAIANDPELISLPDGRYTTQSALKRQRTTLSLSQQGKANKEVSNPYEEVMPQPEQRGLTAELLEDKHLTRTVLNPKNFIGQSVPLSQLKAKNLTRPQTRNAYYFREGDIIIPSATRKYLGLAKNQYYEVLQTDFTERGEDYFGTVTLKNHEGKEITVSLNFEKAVYTRQALNVGIGTRLKWTKNDRLLGRRKGQEFTVTALEETQALIQYDDGVKEVIELAKPLHLDGSLIIDTAFSPGKTAEFALISMGLAMSQESVVQVNNDLLHAPNKGKQIQETSKPSRVQETPLALFNQEGDNIVIKPDLERVSQIKTLAVELLQLLRESKRLKITANGTMTFKGKTRILEYFPQKNLLALKRSDNEEFLRIKLGKEVEILDVSVFLEDIESIQETIAVLKLSFQRIQNKNQESARSNCSITL